MSTSTEEVVDALVAMVKDPNLSVEHSPALLAAVRLLRRSPSREGIEEAAKWRCRAQPGRTPDDPPDCGWPFCGCDTHVDKVLEAISENGLAVVPREPTNEMLIASHEAALAWMKQHGVDGLSPFKDYPSPTATTRVCYIAMIDAATKQAAADEVEGQPTPDPSPVRPEGS